MTRRRLSVTARIALLSIALALVANLALVGFVWRQTHDEAIEAIRRDTIEQSDAILDNYRTGGRAGLIGAMEDARERGDTSLAVMLFDAGGHRVGGFGPAHLLVSPLAPAGFRIATIGDASPWSTAEAGYVLRRVGAYQLLTARILDLVAEEERALERALALSMLLSLALGVTAGLVVTRYVGKRLNAIAGVVERAGQGDLSRRVPLVAGGGDAFDRLAARLNAMLPSWSR